MYWVLASTCILLGALQLVAYAARRFDRWFLWLSASNLLFGAGVACIAARDHWPDALSVVAGPVLVLAGYLVLLASIKMLAGRQLHWRLYGGAFAVASCLLVLVWNDPADFKARVLLLYGFFALCDGLIALEGFAMARRERLASAAVLSGLFALSCLIFSIRIALALTDVWRGPLLSGQSGGAHGWMAIIGTAFVTLRCVALLMTASERNQKALQVLAHADPLTGAMNRAGLRSSFSAISDRTLKEAAPFTLLLADIDDFKRVNDACGHAAGDALLRGFVGAARAQLRACDVVSRHGGDEFVILLPGTGLAEAAEIGERIRQTFGELAAKAQPHMQPTISLGAAAGTAGDPLETLLGQADKALYRSKCEGRNCLHIYQREALAA
jgi:diguanylate cyclase (GGDEF)-like protein